MDLWIRSQDKEILIKCEKIMIEKDRDIFVILNYIDTKNWFRLGYYKSKERALEVLDEIQTILRGKYATSFDYKTALKGFKPEETEKMLELMAVYQMPKNKE